MPRFTRVRLLLCGPGRESGVLNVTQVATAINTTDAAALLGRVVSVRALLGRAVSVRPLRNVKAHAHTHTHTHLIAHRGNACEE